VSSYIQEPVYQKTYGVPDTNGYRATPDVSYNADPNNGYAVYDTIPYGGYTGWFEVGGTSAGTAQWAAMSTLSNKTVTLTSLYKDAAVPSQTKFREIVSGSNGSCGYYCLARVGYNYVTGLGSPLTTAF